MKLIFIILITTGLFALIEILKRIIKRRKKNGV